MSDDQKPKADDLPEGLTLVDPGAPAAAAPGAGGNPLPEGLTEVTPGPNAPGAGVLQNPGGDLPTAPGGPAAANTVIETPKTIPHSVSDFVLNQFPTSAGNFVLNTFGALRHPIDTVEGLAKMASGGVQAAARAAGLHLPENEYDDVAQAFGHYVANRYGSVDKAKEAFYHDPVGVMSDFSLVAGGVGGVADLAGLAKTANVLGTVGEVANPMFLPGKITKGAIKLATPAEKSVDWDALKAQPEFDPKTKEVYQGTGQARTAAQDAIRAQKAQAAQQAQQAAQEQAAQAQQAAQEQAAQAQQAAQRAAQQQARQTAVKDRAYTLAEQELGQGALPGRAHWLQAEQDIPPAKEPPAPKPPKATPQPKAAKPPRPQATPPAAAPPPAPPPTATSPIWDFVKRNTVPALSGVGLGWAAEHFTHALTGSIVAGTLAGGAVKLVPKFLQSPAGQQMLARIGPGSSAANAAAVAHDMIPALNAMYKSTHPEQQLDFSQSPYFHAKGGPVNHELARIQCERLPLRGATIRSLQRA